ncbi:hypothetical protein OS493_021601 [Desmophyllum pertusum]|uniref:Uncharacterized protein n=1 Tax=Desmophyllum pertusum TaxID=174260 RepID=A0A9X0CLE3_9CNID|nr:hypothetical protein OS493_021601 [Desmophyllum pertusum]
MVGQIYAIEFNTSTEESTISRYNMELYSWETVLSSHQGCRKESCIVTAGNHLYVIGGNHHSHQDTLQKLKDSTLWKTNGRKSQTCNKQEAVLVVWPLKGRFLLPEGEITVVTYKVGVLKLRATHARCTMFSTNEWQIIGSLNDWRVYGSMVCLNGIPYVLGGTNMCGNGVLTVEYYDGIKDKWIKKTTIPVKTISKRNEDTLFTGCVLNRE